MTTYLVFRDKLFNEVQKSELTGSELAVLEIVDNTSTLYFSESINLIDKLTAQRQANSIAKTGFLLSNNSRIGANTNLKVVTGSTPLQDKLNEPIRFTVPKEPLEGINEEEILGSSDADEISTLPALEELSSERKSGPSIQDVFREEQKKVMDESSPSGQQSKSTKTYEEVVEYFWKELFGQVYTSWAELPQEAKDDFFASLNIKHLEDNEVQELFSIRHENNIDAFKEKLNEFKARKSG